MYDTKNTPEMEKPKSLVVLGEVVYNADEIYQYDKLFFIGCPRSRLIVEKKNLPEQMYFYAYDKDGTWVKSKETYKRAKLFLSEEYVLQNVPKMMEFSPTEEISEISNTPEILELEEREKFKDVDGNVINIEVRGERNSRNCYFRVRDVSIGFNMPTIKEVLLHKEKGYEVDKHYKCLKISEVTNGHFKNNKKVLYLTYLGMLKVLFCSRTGNAEAFAEWATEKLFTVQMGTEEDRDDLAAELIGVSSKAIQDVFRHNVAKTPCVYLIYIGDAAELLCDPKYTDYMLCKFGRTDDLPRRLVEHARDYKKAFKVNVELLLFSIVEMQFLSTAETNLKQYFGINSVEHSNLKGECSRELVAFHKDELTKIQKHYGMIQTTYIGQLKGLEAELVALQKELSEYKIKLMEEKHNVEKEKYKNELKDKDILLRDKEIELLTMKMSFLANHHARAEVQ